MLHAELRGATQLYVWTSDTPEAGQASICPAAFVRTERLNEIGFCVGGPPPSRFLLVTTVTLTTPIEFGAIAAGARMVTLLTVR